MFDELIYILPKIYKSFIIDKRKFRPLIVNKENWESVAKFLRKLGFTVKRGRDGSKPIPQRCYDTMMFISLKGEQNV